MRSWSMPSNVVVVKAPFAWDDVGSWQAIGRLSPADAQGNAIRAGTWD